LVDSFIYVGVQFELLSQGKIAAKLEVFLEEEKALNWLLKY